MLSGRLYNAQNEELVRMNKNAKRLIRLFNQTLEGESSKRMGFLKELFGSTGEKIWIEPPFHCDYGCHVSVGEGFYANYDCIILDVCPVTIGERVLLGPRVCIYTAAHPMTRPCGQPAWNTESLSSSATMSGSAETASSTPALP